MTRTMKSSPMWMGFDICLEQFRPTRIEFWKGSDFEKFNPSAPLIYHADALIGLSMFLLHTKWKGPHLPERPSDSAEKLWRSMEPHAELYKRSRERIESLRQSKKIKNSSKNQSAMGEFQKKISEILERSCTSWGVDLTDLHEISQMVDQLEDQRERPLLYDFDLEVSSEMHRPLLLLHSLLFNLRTLIATDFNAHVQDATHEAIRVDSVTDYINRGDYVLNDALLYWSFQKIKDQVPHVTAQQMEQAFYSYAHNGTRLIQGLPSAFLEQMKPELREEALYLVQMDWLLGSDAGLLFRIREELFGIVDGYANVFWPDLAEKKTKNPERLSIQCELQQSEDRAA